MSCSNCEYLREAIGWTMCCVCKLKSVIRPKKVVRIAPLPVVIKDEGSASVEMVTVRRTGSHNSIVVGSQEYRNVLEFRKKYSKEALIN